MGYINELFVLLLEVGYLADAPWVCGVGGLKGVSGRGEEAQDRAGGPH